MLKYEAQNKKHRETPLCFVENLKVATSIKYMGEMQEKSLHHCVGFV